jgi:hypothetical protein
MPEMTCDGSELITCIREVKRAPRVIVPARPECPAENPLRLMTTLHYCDSCAVLRPLDVHAWLAEPGRKRRIEALARAQRGPDFKPDFEAATVELLLTTTPEYREFAFRAAARGLMNVANA